MKEIFTYFYENNEWNSTESHSGTGSTLEQTKSIRKGITQIISQFNIKSILDIPCGDFNWMKETDLKGASYTGADIVSPLIERNKEKEGNRHKFVELDITNDPLPKVDLILTRDCLVHFPFEDIFKTFKNIYRSKSKYLLTTTFKDRFFSNNLGSPGAWRPINLERPPFNLKAPLFDITEGCTENAGQYKDKTLSLWDISTLQ